MCCDEFPFPTAASGGRWPEGRPLIDWLEETAKIAINKCARQKIDFSAVVHCIQEEEEAVSNFIQRFTKTWDLNSSIPREEMQQFCISTFLDNMRPQFAASFKIAHPAWSTFDWKTLIANLVGMQRNGVFVMKKTPSKQMAQQTQQNEQWGERKRVRGNCRKCGKAGHWANECRSRNPNRRRQNQYQHQDQAQPGGHPQYQNQTGQNWGPPQDMQPALPAPPPPPAFPPADGAYGASYQRT